VKGLLKRWLVASLQPYAIYLVGYVFESRLPGRDMPVLKDQSLAFLPGEAGLALFVAAAEKVRPTTLARHIAGLLLGLVAFIVIRYITYSPSDYSAKAWWSPTKIYHDVVICGVFGYLVVVRALPFYTGTRFGYMFAQKVLGLTGLAVWATGVVWDEFHDIVPNSRQHPSEWKSIWRRA
jgi:hypothetical protein